jgi:hypothetical protein
MLDWFSALKKPLSVGFGGLPLWPPPLTLGFKHLVKNHTYQLFVHGPSMAHFSPVSFPFVSIGVEHGMNLSPVFSTSLIKIFIVTLSRMSIYSINHFFVLANFDYIPVC